MVLAFFILANATVISLFVKFTKKNLHILEIAMYWFSITILVQNYTAPFVMNLKYLVIQDILSLELSHLINRTVLYPYLCIIFLNRYVILKTAGAKLVLLAFFVFLLSGMEWLEDWLGICVHVHWKVWWTFFCWSIILLISVGVMKFFRKHLKKGLYTDELYNELE
ncbi:hypothetical protein [Paenibacillus hamazuiensis]|uniref:hypothetical protein n=1 Tax=Paenibacillus hamazuiensis TaxID=2936508 RepID=UPI00200EA83F|nr:hypothetical protein [Paenibacillus hamazuiensis]